RVGEWRCDQQAGLGLFSRLIARFRICLPARPAFDSDARRSVQTRRYCPPRCDFLAPPFELQRLCLGRSFEVSSCTLQGAETCSKSTEKRAADSATTSPGVISCELGRWRRGA